MSAANRAAGTALGPMVVVAAEQTLPPGQRVVDDPLAASMLSGIGKTFADLCRWAPMRKLLFALSETKGPGVWGGILSRKRFIDDAVSNAMTGDFGALIILGAGFDTRGIRFALPAGMPVFEIDLPGNIADKRDALVASGGVPDGLHLLPVDFETVDLESVLSDAGYDRSRPALFVWEGVTQYLTEPGVRRTLDFLKSAAAGSRLVFTYVLKDFISGADMHGARPVYRNLVRIQKLWHFGLMPAEVEGFIAPYGWHVSEDAGAEEHRQRNFAPLGRHLPVMSIERVAIAVKSF